MNDLGLKGIEFVEFASPRPEQLDRLFLDFGFSRLLRTGDGSIDYYRQGDIHFLLNRGADTKARAFSRLHGPCISAMGWRVDNAARAFERAVARGARPCPNGDLIQWGERRVPAIYGIGDSLIYFVESHGEPAFYRSLGLQESPVAVVSTGKGFKAIDHLTNNVPKGTMNTWASFYKDIFGFTEVRYFDIRGSKTGLHSYALRSPCGTFCIPINEADEEKSQINEYLREYNGPGIQHLAFLTDDILGSLEALQGTSIETLEFDADYYAEVFQRVPHVSEDHARLQRFNVLVDGDCDGYLLQIFTRNLVGPIFIEIIQRKNHQSFGEGNFSALFRSIERDQMRRGVLA